MPVQTAHSDTNDRSTADLLAELQNARLQIADLQQQVGQVQRMAENQRAEHNTTLKLAELALQESEEKFQSLVETQDALVATVDRSGRLHYINSFGALLMHKTHEEIIGGSLVALLSRPVAETYLTVARRVMERAVGEVFEVRSLAAEKVSWFRTNIQPLRDAAGSVTLALISATDITHRKETELFLEEKVRMRTAEIEAVRQRLQLVNSELERALQLKDEFLANMSHELRTPLNAILGISESLTEGVVGELNDKQAHYISIITESGQHLLALINDILDLSKAEAGKITLDRTEVSLRPLCDACLRLFREMAQKKHILLSFALDPAIESLEADELRLKQMLVNLLSNAMKFTPGGGKVGLEVSADLQQGLVQFSVWDTGIGIRRHDQDKLFKPFAQVDSSLTREQSGTGLGLALVARLASLHGGSVQVESEYGSGSRFTISLPWLHKGPAESETNYLGDPAAPPEDQPAGQAPPQGSLGTILLVEDTQLVVETVKDYLEAHGFQVLVAANGMEGVARAIEHRPDLVLMDVQMPVMNGLEATRHIRAERGFERMPIVAMTALAMPGDRERCLAAGMDAYMSKPVRLAELVQMIRALLAKE